MVLMAGTTNLKNASKMKKYFLYIPALALLAAACNKVDNNEPAPIEEEPTPVVKMITETVSGNRGVETKATISNTNASFKWSIGDNVAVHVSKGDNHKYVVTSKGANAAAASAKFEVTYKDGYSRDAFAVYPSGIVAENAANYGQSEQPLDVTLPSSYTLAQVSGETSPCPMIATNAPGTGWDFYQLCGLLRLTVNDIPTTAKRLEIDFNGKNVAGNFAIPYQVNGDGTSTIALANASGSNSSVITITKDGTDAVLGATSLTVNIPLPVGKYTNVTIKAFDVLFDGSAILTIMRPFECTLTGPMAFMRTATFPSAKTAFRGYEVSTGILKRDASTSPATYSLTSGAMILTADPDGKNEHYVLPKGCNPFEIAVYYGDSHSLDVYFHQWGTLKSDLGEDSGNIKASGVKLPAGWIFPSAGNNQHSTGTDWGNILFGAPKSTITLNGNNVASNAFALVTVTLDAENPYSVTAGTYYGMLLLRDGATISAEHLTELGYDHAYTENQLTQAEFGDLIELGCLFISISGYYDGSWRDIRKTYKQGWYWSRIYYSNRAVAFNFSETGYVTVASRSSDYGSRYEAVKLVKPL